MKTASEQIFLLNVFSQFWHPGVPQRDSAVFYSLPDVQRQARLSFINLSPLLFTPPT